MAGGASAPPGAGLTGESVGSVAEASRVRCARIAELDHSIAVATAERAALLVAERDCGLWKDAGYPTFEAWRARVSGEGLRRARTQLSVATMLEGSPAVAEAVACGAVTVVHAEVLGKIREKAERTSGGALSGPESQELVDLATGEDADTFAKTADRWLARRDSVAHDASHEEMHRRRYLSISHTDRGTYLKGFLDPVAGHTLQIAVEAAMNRPESGDERDYGQRCADALVDVAERAVNGGSLKGGALVRPHVSVILTEETFAQAQQELRRRAAAAATPAQSADLGCRAGEGARAADRGALDGGIRPATSVLGLVEPATFEDGTAVPLNEVARILCDADLTRIVVDADAVPVNLGRTVRLYSREQRRAIIARDRGCQFAGCTQPARWCEVHHIDWWDRDHGQTSIDNGILLCRHHHHEVHRLNLTIHRRAGGARDVRRAVPPGASGYGSGGPTSGATSGATPSLSRVPAGERSTASVERLGELRGLPARRLRGEGRPAPGTLFDDLLPCAEEPDWASGRARQR